VTVCVAAICERGDVVVSATDAATSVGEISSDNNLPKMILLGDWLFMYAGEPSNADLLLEEIRPLGGKITRANIRSVVHKAFQRRASRWASDEILMPFDMDIDEFKRKGKSIFGESHAAEIARQISEAAKNFYDQLLVVGWGDSRMALIQEENRGGSVSHSLLGYAAIGSGGSTAASQLLMLKHARHSSLTETLYSVAAAKFSAEAADGVGQNTVIRVAWKRKDSDSRDQPPGRFIQLQEIDVLRAMWLESGKPKVPYLSYKDLKSVLDKSGIDFEHSIGASVRYAERVLARELVLKD
jgi:20S proteasome alpha/beta subunit